MEQWFQEERGISPETLEEFGVTTTHDEARFPYGDAFKIRKHDPDGTRHFRYEGKYEPTLFTDKSAVSTPTMFLVEGESDTMRLWQELGKEYTVMGLPGIEMWKDEFAEAFERADKVFVILDNDTDYKVVARVDACWRSIRKSLGPKAVRIRLPKSIKDVCEFFSTYDAEALRMLAEAATSDPLHYKALDLKSEPRPVDWLVENYLAQGDVAVMIGEGNVGKSWLSMSLAASVANGGGTWLGHEVKKGGRVLYVDEENPEDVVISRMRRLGLTDEGADNIRYIHQQGVRLDKHPDRLLDEAIAYAPTLVVLDCLTRLHTQDENNAGAIAALFNEGINPLSRETGASTLLLHHVTKTDSGSSFVRARGSSDIGNSVDTGLDVRKYGTRLHVVHFKSRRRQTGDVIEVQILDTPQGSVDLAISHNPVF